MDSVETYLADILAAIRPLPPRELALADALGAVLVDDVTAQWPLPSFDNSAMDGYAVRAADVATASADNPVVLPVDGEIAAGDTGSTRPRSRHGHPDHDRSADARRRRRGGPGRAHRRRHRAVAIRAAVAGRARRSA